MMNNFIEIEMMPTASGVGGSFHTRAGFTLDNFRSPFLDIEVKIDTGCSISTIPLQRLKVSNTLCKVLKRVDICNHVPYYLSYGVESGGLKHKRPITEDEKMNCSAMKFAHKVSNLTIAGVQISCDNIYLNYDRKGNILIGMDILREWDIHMGISKITGKNLFLACSKENLCPEYQKALMRHFDLLQTIR